MEESIRQKKVSKLVQRELGTYFQRHGTQFAAGGMITVTVVRVSPDLGLAKVYLSVFGVNDKPVVVDKINEGSATVRYSLGKDIKNQVRHIPALHFYLDDSLDALENIERLLKNG